MTDSGLWLQTTARRNTLIMSSQYYIRLAGRVRGPFSLDSLVEQIDRGTVSLQLSEVSTDRRNWSAATAFHEIGEAVGQTAGTPRSRKTRSRRKQHVVEFEPVREKPMRQESQPGSRDAEDWRYTLNGKPVDGSVSSAALVQLIRNGTIGPDEKLWNPSLTDWISVGESEFSHALGEPRRLTLSGWARSCSIVGAIAYLLTLGATVCLIRVIRRTQLDVSDNTTVVLLIVLALIFGAVTLWTGHTAIAYFRKQPGSPRERGTIIAGLSGGYTAVIVGVILGIATFFSATDERVPPAGTSTELAEQ